MARRKHPPNPKIRSRIRKALDWHGMNQAGLAEMLGLSAASVSLFLNGHTQPADDTVRKIAEGLGEEFEFLMGYTDKAKRGMGGAVGAIIDKATPDELAMLRDLSDADFHEAMGKIALGRSRRKSGKGGKAILALAGGGLGAHDAQRHVDTCLDGCESIFREALNVFPSIIL